MRVTLITWTFLYWVPAFAGTTLRYKTALPPKHRGG
jgi:hypothetical protein